MIRPVNCLNIVWSDISRLSQVLKSNPVATLKMHSVWVKLVISGLIVLGDGMFASDRTQHGDNNPETSSTVVQQSKLPSLHASGDWQDLDQQDPGYLPSGNNLYLQKITAVTASVSVL